MSFVSSSAVVSYSDGTTSINVNPNTTYLYNFTINSNDKTLTQVTIVLPEGFQYQEGSAWTDNNINSRNMMTSENMLMWYGGLSENTINSFWFNASSGGLSSGKFDIDLMDNSDSHERVFLDVGIASSEPPTQTCNPETQDCTPSSNNSNSELFFYVFVAFIVLMILIVIFILVKLNKNN